MTTDIEIFNIVKEHLLDQDAKSMNSDNSCAYRNKTGLKCAIGVLIKDEFYHPRLEGNTPEHAEVSEALEQSNPDWDMGKVSMQMLWDLQNLHDCSSVLIWEELLNSEFHFNEDGSYRGRGRGLDYQITPTF